MSLSEKLYRLRRKQGLSQEELAERLNCSRQVISKWENGTTTPDAGMLQKYSKLFGVSVDYLLKETMDDPSDVAHQGKNSENRRLLGIVGLVIALLGCAALIVFGAIAVFGSGTADRIAGSSVIVIDGTCIALFLSALFAVLGAIMLIKSTKYR